VWLKSQEGGNRASLLLCALRPPPHLQELARSRTTERFRSSLSWKVAGHCILQRPKPRGGEPPLVAAVRPRSPRRHPERVGGKVSASVPGPHPRRPVLQQRHIQDDEPGLEVHAGAGNESVRRAEPGGRIRVILALVSGDRSGKDGDRGHQAKYECKSLELSRWCELHNYLRVTGPSLGLPLEIAPLVPSQRHVACQSGKELG
jgi:hypothetical protein